MPRMPAPSVAPPSPRPSSVIRSRTASGSRRERQLDAGGVGVPGDVRQAFLGDPVEHQLRVRSSSGSSGSSLRVTGTPLAWAKSVANALSALTRPRSSSTPGPQPAGDLPHLVEAPADHLLDRAELVPQLVRAPGRRPA